MADFAFTRQDETKVLTSETTRIVPLTCHGHSRPITHVSYSALLPGTTPHYYMISACKDNNPMMRDGLTGDWVGTFIGHKGAVWSSRLSDDAALAATGSADFTAKVWDTHTGENLLTLQHNHIVRAVAFAPGKPPRMLATGGMEKKLRIYDITHLSESSDASSELAKSPLEASHYEVGAGEHQGAIKSIVWSRNPNILSTAAEDKKLRWWDLRSRTSIATYDIDGLPMSCELNNGLSRTSEGTLTVAAGKNVYFFDASKPGHLIKHIKCPHDVASVALNAAARRFVTGSPSDTWVHVWDFDSEQELETGRGHHGPVWTTAFTPDGKMYATGSEDGTVKLWKFTDGPYGLWK